MVNESLDDYVKDAQSPGPLRIAELETPIDTRNADPGPAVRYLAWGIPVKTQGNPDNRSLQVSIHSINSNDVTQSSSNKYTHAISSSYDSIHTRRTSLDSKMSSRTKQAEARSFAHHFVRKYSTGNSVYEPFDHQKENINEEMRTPSRINNKNNFDEFQVSNYSTRIYPSPNYFNESDGSKFDFSTTKSAVNASRSTPTCNFISCPEGALYDGDTPSFFHSASIGNDDYSYPSYSYDQSLHSSYMSNSVHSPNKAGHVYSSRANYLNGPLVASSLPATLNYSGDCENPFKYNKTQSTSTGKDLTSNDSECFSQTENNLLSSVSSEMWNNYQVDTTHSIAERKNSVKHECECKSLQDQLSSLKDMFSEFKTDFENVVNKMYNSQAGAKAISETEDKSEEDKLEDQISGVPADVLEGYRAALTIKRMLHVKSMNSIVPAFTSFLHKRMN